MARAKIKALKGNSRDGFNLETVIKMISQIEDIRIEKGGRHPYVIYYEGKSPYNLEPCCISRKSLVKQILVPWLRKVTGHDSEYIYNSLRKGYWIEVKGHWVGI